MAAFGDIGGVCAEPTCGCQDFLPFECDACGRSFCKDHFRHAAHNCTAAANRDRQVAVCPRCRASAPLLADGIDPLEAHQCSAAPSIAVKRCAAKGCKEHLHAHNTVRCWRCSQNVCIRHRFEDDHPCVAIDVAVRQVLLKVTKEMTPLEFSEAQKTIVKVFGNVLAEPGNEKFRTLKKSNAIVKEKLRNPACIEALRLGGFEEKDDVFVCKSTADLSVMRQMTATLKAYRPEVPTSGGGYATSSASGSRLVNGVIVRSPAVVREEPGRAQPVKADVRPSSTPSTSGTSVAKHPRDFGRRVDAEEARKAQEAQLAEARRQRKEGYQSGAPSSTSSVANRSQQMAEDEALARRLSTTQGRTTGSVYASKSASDEDQNCVVQ